MTRRSWLVLLGAALVAIGLQTLWTSATVRRMPLPDARWIWASGVSHPAGDERKDAPEPVAFLVVRDVVLEAGDLDEGGAFVEIVADEGYRLWVNGTGPGTGVYRPDAPIDRWEIATALRPGPNRIAIEVRSRRGAGGLLARIEVGHRAWSTDEEWRIARTWSPGILFGWGDLVAMEQAGELERPRLWGGAASGRWRVEPASGTRDLPLAPSVREPVAHPVRVRHPAGDEGDWKPLREQDDPWGLPHLEDESLWDFGRSVEGLAALEIHRPADLPALLYCTAELPDPEVDFPTIVVPIPGAGRWEAIVPGRCRYLLVIGAALAAVPEILPPAVDGPAVSVPSGSVEGIFGLRPPRERSRAEEQVWSRVRPSAAGS